MTPEVQQRIFDPFFTSKGKGRGLGLAAVLGIVSHHDAALTLESTPGAGTVFSVYFPACVEPADRRSDRPSAVGLQGSGTVLVADDEPCVRDLIARYLEMLGLTTVTAANGVEAVERVHAHRGHLAAIFMDYSMPEMNGAEAFRLIRRDDPEVPFIMLSGYGERDALGAITDDHRTEFLQKPFELAELASVLRESFGLLAKQGEA